MKVLVESQYFPSVAYFALISQADEIYIDHHEHFEKQSYRNRFHLLGSNQELSLSIPVHHAGRKIRITELGIDYNQKWINNHWRAIQSAYGKAPFFDYYADYFKEELEQEHEFLFTLNQNLLTICLRLLQLSVTLHKTPEYWKTPPSDIEDYRSVIHPKKSLDRLTWFQPQSYHQIFGSTFVPNLSILDLLFCMGPDAKGVLQKSIVNRNK